MKKHVLLVLVLTAALSFIVFGTPKVEQPFTAHEWGTFTSVQGADGVQLAWNPHITSELPEFVYDRSRLASTSKDPIVLLGKNVTVCLQRMETPVIYFYSDTARTVDVTVRFPQGQVTEWFPQIQQFPVTDTNNMDLRLNRGLRWTGVQILPEKVTSKNSNLLPMDKTGSHYYAARLAEANLLSLKSPDQTKTEYEKFLFYRGVGNFQAPLKVTMGADEDYVSLNNAGAENLSHFFVLQVKKGQAKFVSVAELAPGKIERVKLEPGKSLQPLAEVQKQISTQMIKALTSEGLYASEANAMVQTWHDSWFAEDGVRVLYILPLKWTDRTLPLTIEPKAADIVRVMVGRAELLTPNLDREVATQITRFAEGTPESRQQAIAGFNELGLGRFSEPAIRRAISKTPTPAYTQAAYGLFGAARTAPPGSKPLAQK